MPEALLVECGKQPGRSLMAANATRQFLSRLFFVLELVSHRCFLVDTGAEISAVPSTKADRKCCQNGVTFQAANGASIANFGQRSLPFNLGLRSPFRWIFTIADVKHPIVGDDFLGHHSLLVDVKNKMLIDSTTHLQSNIICTHQNTHSLTTLNPLSLNPFSSLV